MANKMTKVQWYEAIAEAVEASDYEMKDEAVAFLQHEKELLQAKSSSKKPSKAQKENVGIKALILETLQGADKVMTVSELLGTENLSGYSSQKVSALLSQMRKEGTVVRVEDKKKAYFSAA